MNAAKNKKGFSEKKMAVDHKTLLGIAASIVLSVIGGAWYAGQQTNDIASRVTRNERDIADVKASLNTYTLAVTGIDKNVALVQSDVKNLVGQVGEIKQSLTDAQRDRDENRKP